MSTVSEETLNVVLAQLLLKRSLRTLGEARIHGLGMRKPDVFILVNGVKVILEGKYARAGARRELEEKCRERIDEGLCEICISIEYPFSFDSFLSPTMGDVERMLLGKGVQANISLVASEGIKSGGWIKVEIDGLANLIRNSYTSIVGEDLLGQAVESLSSSLSEATKKMMEISDTEVIARRVRTAIGLDRVERESEAE